MNNYLVIRKSQSFSGAEGIGSIGVIEAESEEEALKEARVILKIPPDLMGSDGLMVVPFGEIRRLSGRRK